MKPKLNVVGTNWRKPALALLHWTGLSFAAGAGEISLKSEVNVMVLLTLTASDAYADPFNDVTLYIEPGSPWQNAYRKRLRAPSGAALRAACGRFSRSARINSRFRDEFLNRESFASVIEAKVPGKQHRHRQNQQRPHSSLEYQTPVEFAQRSRKAAPSPPAPSPPTHTKLS